MLIILKEILLINKEFEIKEGKGNNIIIMAIYILKENI